MSKPSDSLRSVPPQNLEAETCVLGAVLIENDPVLAIKNYIDATDFYLTFKECAVHNRPI
jgi:replicative DNA helicase